MNTESIEASICICPYSQTLTQPQKENTMHAGRKTTDAVVLYAISHLFLAVQVFVGAVLEHEGGTGVGRHISRRQDTFQHYMWLVDEGNAFAVQPGAP